MDNNINIINEIRDYEKGAVSIEELEEKLIMLIDSVENSIVNRNEKSISHINTARNEAKSIGEAAEESKEYISQEEMGNKLRFYALFCDIGNNLFHALKEDRIRSGRKIKGPSQLEVEMVSLKKVMAKRIIRECDEIGNESYGMIIKSVNDKVDTFCVDIPSCGQIAWHFPAGYLRTKPYLHQPEINKTKENSNAKCLCQELTTADLDNFSDRMRAVAYCVTIAELRNLEDNVGTTGISNLSDLVNKNISADLPSAGDGFDQRGGTERNRSR